MSDNSLVPLDHTDIVTQPSARELATPRTWHSVGFKLVVHNRRISNTFSGGTEVEKVCGNGIGLRSDGQTFFISVDLPWIWTHNTPDWTREAQYRLNSFLDPRCLCECLSGTDLKLCAIHKDLRSVWEDKDALLFPKLELKKLEDVPLPNTDEKGGATEQLLYIRRDYPWIRKNPLKQQLVCTLCTATFQMHTYSCLLEQNEFIIRHSHCGYGDAKDPLPKLPESVMFDELLIILSESQGALRLVPEFTRKKDEFLDRVTRRVARENRVGS